MVDPRLGTGQCRQRYLAIRFRNGLKRLAELQWYFYAAVYMLAAAYTLKRNEHVRIDLISSRLTAADP